MGDEDPDVWTQRAPSGETESTILTSISSSCAETDKQGKWEDKYGCKACTDIVERATKAYNACVKKKCSCDSCPVHDFKHCIEGAPVYPRFSTTHITSVL